MTSPVSGLKETRLSRGTRLEKIMKSRSSTQKASFQGMATRTALLPVFAVSLATLGFVLSANANERKTAITTFDAPGAVNGTSPTSINPRGSITGFYFDANFVPHGFLRAKNGSFTTFDAPGAGLQAGLRQGTYATSINPGGAITGFYFDANSVPHGFLRANNGSFTTFDLPVGSSLANVPPQPGSAISPDGSVAGTYLDASLVGHGFLRAPHGAFTTFDAPGGSSTFATSINPAGAITGYYVAFTTSIVFHGFLRAADGAITTFDAPGGTYTIVSSGNSINPEGIISGNYYDASFVSHGFLRAADGTFATFDVPGAGTGPFQGTGGFGVAINPARATAGTYTDAGDTTHGFLRAGDGSTITAFDPQGSVFTFPASINPAGSITGSYVDANSVSHGFLRSP
jgi:hypothetical protein